MNTNKYGNIRLSKHVEEIEWSSCKNREGVKAKKNYWQITQPTTNLISPQGNYGQGRTSYRLGLLNGKIMPAGTDF